MSYFKSRLRDGDLCLIEFNNPNLCLINIVIDYLEKKHIDVDGISFNSEESLLNFPNNSSWIRRINDDYKPKTDNEYEDKKELLAS